MPIEEGAIPEVSKIVGVVPFIDGIIDESIDLENSKFNGCLIYYLEEGLVKLDVFKLDNSVLKPIREKQIVVKGISSNDIYVASKFLRDYDNTPISSLIFINYSDLPPVNLFGSDITFDMLDVTLPRHKAPIGGHSSGGGTTCNTYSPCGSTTGDWCIAQESQGHGESWDCWINPATEEWCPKEQADEDFEALNYVPDNSMDNTLYEIRDSLLIGSLKGAVYKDFYHYMGSKIGPLTLSVGFIQDSYDIANNLLVPKLDDLLAATNGNAILINQTEADDILNYLDVVMALSSDPMYESIVYTVKLDIQHYVGKTINEILLDF